MRLPRVLTFVLAGGEGRRLWPLTASVPKPALPLTQGYRIVDFVLSNLLNSGLTSVYVIAQYKPIPLLAHLEGCWKGRFAAAGGFARWLLPSNGPTGVYAGTADAVHRNLDLIREHEPDVVAVFAADHVYRMDVRPMLSFHLARDAQVTAAATRVPVAEASSFGVIAVDDRQRIVGFAEKPSHPASIPGDPAHALASMGIYLFRPEALSRELERCMRAGGSDFGHHIMPMLVGQSGVYAYDFLQQRVPGLAETEDPCYWRDVGTPEALEAARAEAAGPTPRIRLENPAWPIHKERRKPGRSLSRAAMRRLEDACQGLERAN